MLVGYITMLPDDYENLSQSVIATNFFGNNILGAITTGNYWDVVNDYKPLMHTWYVGVIMQFYIVFPILFYLARLDKRNSKGTLLTIIATLAVTSLLVYFAITNTAHRFYYLPSRFFEFAVGGIAALLYKPQEDKPFSKGFVYVSYILLIALMYVNVDILPANIRLVAVVGLSCVLLCSQDVLENKVTGNAIISKIGAASYSIFIWHQVLLAFYRYSISNKFTIGSYAILLAATMVLSWLSYYFIEQGVTKALKSKRERKPLYVITIIIFVALNAFAGIVYLRAGVVRDVPELDIYKNNVHRGMFAEYSDRIYEFDKDFQNHDKLNVFIIGNSFARDWANVLLESEWRDSINISYVHTDNVDLPNIISRRSPMADVVFIHMDRSDVPKELWECVPANVNVWGIGIKNYGESNGIIYAKRFTSEYFNLTVSPLKEIEEINTEWKREWGENYIDIMSYSRAKNGEIKVFTPDHKFISMDCRHLTQAGCRYYSTVMDLNKYLRINNY